MRLRSICVHVDRPKPESPRLRARCFQYEGKSSVVWGRTVSAQAMNLSTVRRDIEKAFRGKVRSVYVTYAPEVGRIPATEMMEFYPVEIPATVTLFDPSTWEVKD